MLLVGPGAIGLTVAGAVLQRPEMALAVAARTPFDTIAVELDEERIECEVPVLTDPFAITGPFHLVLLGTKAHQTPDVAVARRSVRTRHRCRRPPERHHSP